MSMQTRNIMIKRGLFGGLLLLMFLPMMQGLVKVFPEKPLHGAYAVPEEPVFSMDNWLNGAYQDQVTESVKFNIGFRGAFVRIYNQMQYALYNQATANQVVIGKDGFLYEENYIKAHLGMDYIGEDTINEKVKKLNAISSVLSNKGVELVVVMAPGKGSFYPAYFPAEYDTVVQGPTNYEAFKNAFQKTDIHLLNFYDWFQEMKSSSPYPLFPKTGIHWSKYGELLAADSIINYLNTLSEKTKIPKLILGEITTSNVMRDTDDDIEKGLNLLFDLDDFEMAYPAYRFEENNTQDSPKVLTIADSYYWGMFNLGLSNTGFNQSQFWYYNNQVYPDSYNQPLHVADLDMVAEVEKNQFVLLVVTDANLYKFCFGFIDQLYEAYGLSD